MLPISLHIFSFQSLHIQQRQEGIMAACLHRLPLFIILIFLLTIPCPAASLRFELRSGFTKCFYEEINSNAIAVGKYAVVDANSIPGNEYLYLSSPDAVKIYVKVTCPLGNEVHYGENVDHGEFGFTASNEGRYMACLWAPHRGGLATIVVDFDWRTGVSAKHYIPSAAPKKTHLHDMEHELKVLEDVIKSIHDEMLYLRQRERISRDLNTSTNLRMAWLGLISFGLCISVTGVQVWYLKTFFEKKKIL